MSTRRYTAADLVTPDVIANPYPAYAALRADSPVAGYADHPPGTVWLRFRDFMDTAVAAAAFEGRRL